MPTNRSITERLLTIFGDIKVYPYPLFVLYDPGSYLVRGEDVRKVLEKVSPGDILLRGFRRYLDGYFIPGKFSHVGLYVGAVEKSDEQFLTPGLGTKMFQTGEQMVFHAMAEGVLMEDLLTFCRCDYLVILRFPEVIKRVPGSEPLEIPKIEFSDEEKAIYYDLEKGNDIEFQSAFPAIKAAALRNLGRPYDFGFDFGAFDRLSCTQFVYLCTKSLGWFLQIQPIVKRVIILTKKMIIPDAFLSTGLEPQWWSKSSRERFSELITNSFE